MMHLDELRRIFKETKGWFAELRANPQAKITLSVKEFIPNAFGMCRKTSEGYLVTLREAARDCEVPELLELVVHELFHAVVEGYRGGQLSKPPPEALARAPIGDRTSFFWVTDQGGRHPGAEIVVNTHTFEHLLIKLATFELLGKPQPEALRATSEGPYGLYDPEAMLDDLEGAIDEWHTLFKQRIQNLRHMAARTPRYQTNTAGGLDR